MVEQLQRLFKSDRLARRMSDRGWAVLRDEVSVETLERARRDFDNGNEMYDRAYLSGSQSPRVSPSRRQDVFTLFEGVMRPLANKILRDCSPYYGSYVVKPASGQLSTLGIHQDQTMIPYDSRRGSVTMWMPLVDVDRSNGCIGVWDRSHSLHRRPRAEGMKFAYADHAPAIWSSLTDVTMSAGDVLLMDQGLIHASWPNGSTESRVALTGMYAGVESDVVCYRAPVLGSLLTEYVVSRDFYVSHVPNDAHRFGTPTRRVQFAVENLPNDVLKALNDAATQTRTF